MTMRRRWYAGVMVAAVVGAGIAAGPVAAAGGWSAPVSLSTPIPPTDVVGNPAIAVNASGAEVAAWYDQAADGTQFVHVRTSADGSAWSAATTLGHGIAPAVALAGDGRAVAVWWSLDGAGSVRASVRPPGGSWSAGVTVSPDAGSPKLGVDQSGDAIAAWSSSSVGLQTASLPAGGAWTSPNTLATGLSDFDLAVNAGGTAVAAWTASGGSIVADYGSVLGGWAPPSTVAAAAYRQKGVHAAVNDAGQGALAWRTRTGAKAATATPAGVWSTPTVLVASQGSGSVDVAIDGAGNAAAVVVIYTSGGATFPVYVSRMPAGGGWGPPALLSTLNDYAPAPQVVADPAGTFVAAWTDDNALSLRASTSPPGGGFGAPVVVGSNYGEFNPAIAPGRAVLMWTAGGATVSSEPVT